MKRGSHGCVLRSQEVARGQIIEVHEAGMEELGVGLLGGKRLLDLVIVDDAPGVGVDEEHASWLEATLLHDRGHIDGQHTHLGGHDHEAVLGDPVARGS